MRVIGPKMSIKMSIFCLNNGKVLFKRYLKRTNKNGFTRDIKIYECEDCSECPLKLSCTKGTRNRQVH